MRIMIVSDTHGREENLERALEEAGRIDRLIHLGDVEGGEDYIRMITGVIPVNMVAGNCDYWSSDLPEEIVLELGEHKAFLTHGHLYGVNGGVRHLRTKALEKGADIAMFGHTHRPYLEEDEGVLILNPGSLSFPRQEGRDPSYLIMEMDEQGKIECTPCFLE